MGRTERQSESATRVAGAYTVRGSPLEAGAATYFSHREAYEDVLLGGGELLKNWRPDFLQRHRRYAELRAIFGPPLLSYPIHGEVSPEPDPGGFGGVSPRYNDSPDKSFLGTPGTDYFNKPCPGHFLIGSCENGHRFAKEIYDFQEWCPRCGAKWSEAHQRKFSRWLPKVQQMRQLGYLVIEWPLASRFRLRSKAALEDSGKMIKQVLGGEWEIERRRQRGDRISRQRKEDIRAWWFPEGLRRWHFFGDLVKELGEGMKSLAWVDKASESQLNMTFNQVECSPGGQGDGYNPHLNVLVPYGFITRGKFRRIKKALRTALQEPDLIIHYGYTKEPARMVHALKYVTRATFLDWMWAPDVAASIYNFHNAQVWGRWDGEQLWSLDELEGEPELKDLPDPLAVESLESGICPRCGKPLDWTGPYPIKALEGMERHALGAGYYELSQVRAPPGMNLVMMLKAAGYFGPVIIEGELCGN
ncbi:hypothetical protein ES703_40340 [subsurface metagenome]